MQTLPEDVTATKYLSCHANPKTVWFWWLSVRIVFFHPSSYDGLQRGRGRVGSRHTRGDVSIATGAAEEENVDVANVNVMVQYVVYI
jgi:hypothetical protein